MGELVTEDQQREEYPKRDKAHVREEKEKRDETKRNGGKGWTSGKEKEKKRER